jgi:hypothetical protein
MTETTTTPKALQKLEQLVERGKQGKQDAAAKIERYLVEHPELYEAVGNLTAEVKEQLITHIAQEPYARIALTHHISALKTKISGEQPFDAVEGLLIDEVIISYLLLRASDLFLIKHRAYATSTDMRRNAQYSARFTRACTALARYRKMGLTIQINVGAQQVNLA